MPGEIMSLEEMRNHKWVVSWSGGKDSTATILLMIENHIPIKRITYVRMMYDESLPATLPIMTEFVDETIERFRNLGIEVQMVYSIRTAKQNMNRVYKRSKYPECNGKPYGITAFNRGHCTMSDTKIKTLKKIHQDDEYQMIGYCSDEVLRIPRLGDKKQSILFVLGLTEKDAYKICRDHNMLSPLYDLGISRDGCWFCPNASKKERCYLKNNYPELVDKINQMKDMCNYDISRLTIWNNWLRELSKET